MTGSALVIPLLSHWKCLLITLAVDSRFLKHLRKRQMSVHVKNEQPWISLGTKPAPAQHPWAVCVENGYQEALRHLIFIFFPPFTICCSTERICNAVSPPKCFISVSRRLHRLLCFGACSALTFQMLSCLQCLVWCLVCCGVLRLCPDPAYFMSGKSEWKKGLFYYYLNDYLVKLFSQAPCVQIHALYFVPATQTLLFLWELQQTPSGTCLARAVVV